jgi:sec-independent protein translocase protein TatC
VNDEGRADLVTHLTELRARLLRSIIYAVLGMVVVWIFLDPIYRFLMRPIIGAVKKGHGQLNVQLFLEGFMIRVEIALIGGLMLAAPFIYYEIWAFIAPGLTRNERRAARPLVPISGLLFLVGVAFGYLLTGPSVEWLMKMNPPETVALYRLNDNLLLIMKFYLALGISFQLPIVIVLLAKLGIVDSRLLSRRWREAVIVIFVVAAIITPTWDPITMTIAAIPMVLLYLGTIGVVKVIERNARKAQNGDLVDT